MSNKIWPIHIRKADTSNRSSYQFTTSSVFSSKKSITKLIESRQKEFDNLSNKRTRLLSSDVVYVRHVRIVETELRPDVDVLRTDAELAIFEKAQNIVSLFDTVPVKRRRYRAYPGIDFRFALGSTSSIGYIELRTTMRCLALDVLASKFDVDGFETVTWIESVNNHSVVMLINVPLSPFSPRQFVNICMWRKVELGPDIVSLSANPDSLTVAYQFVVAPTTHRSVPEIAGTVRGETYEVAYLLEHTSTCETEYVAFIHSDPKGDIPGFLVNHTIVANNGTRAMLLVETFQRRRIVDELDEYDGILFGNAFVIARREVFHRHHSRRSRSDIVAMTQRMIDQYISLSEVSVEIPAFVSILAATISNRLSIDNIYGLRTINLDQVTIDDGDKIGKALSIYLFSSTDPVAAVADWIGYYPSVTQLSQKYVWFKPMMTIIATEIVRESSWGMVMRLLFGTIISIADVVSDIVMIIYYIKSNQTVFAQATIICVAQSILFQIIIVFAQYKNASRRRLLSELAIALSFTKPIWDTYNVCSGKEQDAEQLFSPLSELSIIKLAELAGESIPGSIIQTYAYTMRRNITSPHQRALALTSIVTSMATIAYISVTVTYDFDSDPHRRKTQSSMYGMLSYSPLRRVTAFVSMFFMSLSQVVGRIVACAMLARIGTRMGYFLLFEMSLYLAVKIARHDFVYWLPNENRFYTIILTFGLRMFRKIVCDFTGLLQERHPYEMGGLLFSLNTIFSQTVPYLAKSLVDADDAEIDRLLTSLTVVWTISAITFALSINRRYLWSFVSTETAVQYTVRWFREADNDESKFNAVFTNHHSYTEPIIGEVKQWMNDRYPVWLIEHPHWFTDTFRAMIPKHILPVNASSEEVLDVGDRAGEPTVTTDGLIGDQTHVL